MVVSPRLFAVSLAFMLTACGSSGSSAAGDGSLSDALANDGANDGAPMDALSSGDGAVSDGSAADTARADAPTGPPCGPVTCAAGDVCCDHCMGSCVPAESGAFCPDDNDPGRTCGDGGTDFACADRTCDKSSEYCSTFVGGPARPDGGFDSVECLSLPVTCSGTPSCDCITNVGCSCSGDAEVGITVSCAAP